MKINKISLKGKAKILETDTGKIVVKPKKKELMELFDYLQSRDFNSYPKIIDEDNEEVRYEYYEDSYFHQESDEDFIRSVGELHYKTTYFKNVSRKKYKEIYNTLIENVDYLKDYYGKIIHDIDMESYMSPSDYLLARNYTIINTSLIYIEKELNAWYNLVKDKTKERVCVVHNNLKKENVIRGSTPIFTGWDNFLVDTPVLDIYKLYKNEYKTMDFENLLKVYNETFELSKEEVKLFKVIISMPQKLEENTSEYNKVMDVKEMLDYIYRTNNVIKSGVLD